MVADSVLERRKAFQLGLTADGRSAKILLSKNAMVSLKLLIIGNESDNICEHCSEMPIAIKPFGRLTADQLVCVYRSIVGLLSLSIVDNWPNILVEAYACGAKIVVGPGHGCAEFATLYDCGVVAKSYEVGALANDL